MMLVVSWGSQKPRSPDMIAHTERLVHEAIQDHMDFFPEEVRIMSVILSSNRNIYISTS